ncbi:MAG: sucrase ferredoxin [Pseudomonadaceae bacterium]|nr:sucrase ferredoxin [Pseudomonadaceae bacterium]
MTSDTSISTAYCSQVAPTLSMAGTADPVDIFVMLEYRGPWSEKVVANAPFNDAMWAWLAELTDFFAAREQRAKVLFIKRSGLHSAGPLNFMICGRGVMAERNAGRLLVSEHDELRRIPVQQLASHLEPLLEPQYFVCTNGRRDVCCARFGLPVYRALRDRVGDRAWQVSHVGGHRFAPNVLVLPDAALYGRVHLVDVPRWLEHVEAGELAMPWLRGRPELPKPAQAAEVHLAVGAQQLKGVSRDGDASVVEFESAIVEVRAGEPVLTLPSCGKAEEAITPLVCRTL